MINGLTSVTSALVRVALDANLQSQRVSAHNIANVNSEGYQALALNFDDIYTDAAALLEVDNGYPASRFDSLKQEIQAGAFVQSTESEVALDMEMVRLNEVVVQYQALLKGLSKYGSLVKMAINGEQGK